MGKLEEEKLQKMRAQIIATRQTGGGQGAPSQSGQASSTTSSIWDQKAATRCAQERSTIQQLPPTSHPANPPVSGTVGCQQDFAHVNAPVVTQRATSSIGISNMSVNDRNLGWQGAMNSAYGNSCQSMHSQQAVGAMSQRPTDVFHHKEEFEPGAVFSAVTHEHHYRQDRVDHSNANQTETNFGITNSKFRKFVVLSRFEHHVIALPILTHEGRGLTTKRHKHEYVSVRDRMAQVSAASGESSHGVLWAETYPNFQYASAWHRMSDTCCLHITRPYSHNMAHKCTISGRLEDESFVRLQKLFRDAVLKAAAGKISQSLPRAPAAIMEESPTTPRAPSFPQRQSSVAGTGPRPVKAWSSTRSNMSQYSTSAR
ncbi:hypothetical protein BKA65DRAFT_481376 [Rhexocercosporidium sp. MPI-PUGE-AT-0058]|nr:hypothetical protein BKA65DRAFT_481376 [Rhexocercosporidium sp. MPI-PUGE-AT-0058]